MRQVSGYGFGYASHIKGFFCIEGQINIFKFFQTRGAKVHTSGKTVCRSRQQVSVSVAGMGIAYAFWCNTRSFDYIAAYQYIHCRHFSAYIRILGAVFIT